MIKIDMAFFPSVESSMTGDDGQTLMPPKLIVRGIVLSVLTLASLSTANAESYNCRIKQFEGPDHSANVKPWIVKDGKITLGYHGDLLPTPPMSFPIVKDDADQLIAAQYVHNQPKGPNQTEILIIDKNASKVNFLLVLPGARYIEHYVGRCTKP